MFNIPSPPSPGVILETRRSRVVPGTNRDAGLFAGWGPRMLG
jgi:hypothetical protein